jgi:CheY-like chemotaxis protein
MGMARVLLVDDNKDNLDVLAWLLSERHSVSAHGSAAEALRALETVKPDLLVLDICMTPVDGVECLEAIRAVPGYSRIPAIALTAFARDVEREAFLGAGFQAVVTKPILDHRELMGYIDRLLQSPVASVND